MVLGNDFAGTVATTGAKVSTFKPADRVYGLKPVSADGTHASHVLVKAAHVLRAPSGGRSSGAGSDSLQLRNDVAGGDGRRIDT